MLCSFAHHAALAIVVDAGERTSTMTTIHADELEPGDFLTWEGQRRRIVCVERRVGWSWPIALDGTGWAIALDHHLIDVDRNTA
jgi:hypothetical protein